MVRTTSAAFNTAADKSKTLKNADNTELLELYSLFKIAREEDVAAGGVFNPTQKAKHTAWSKKKETGISAQDAETAYIKYVDELIAKYGTK